MSIETPIPLCEAAFHGDSPTNAVVYMRLTLPDHLTDPVETGAAETKEGRMTRRWLAACPICRDRLRHRAQLAAGDDELAGLAFEERPAANAN
ncbi:hypothetical protein [Nocardia sp. CA-120079]|uniref:hypothetical protein n=1 Tax=Nocardia sp. CA-120079 TaxID=3239974 RepID=UPI003D995E03